MRLDGPKSGSALGRAVVAAAVLLLLVSLPGCFLDFTSNARRQLGGSSVLAAELVWGGATTVGAGDCYPYTISTRNLEGEAIIVREAISLQLVSLVASLKKPDVFYTDPSCVANYRLPFGPDFAEFTFPAGVAQTTIYVRQIKSGDTRLRITSPDEAYRSGDHRVTVNPGGLAKIEVRGPRQLGVSSCGQYSAVRVDVFGNAITSSTTTSVLIGKGQSSAKLYQGTDTNCLTPSESLLGNINSGQSSLGFRMKDTRAEDVDLSGNAGAIHVVSVSPGTPSALFLDGPDALAVSQCGEYRIVRQDPDANRSATTSSLNVSLSPVNGFFLDSACSTTAGGLAPIASGKDEVVVYFRYDSVDPAVSLSVSASNHAPSGKLIDVRAPGSRDSLYGTNGLRVLGSGWATAGTLDASGNLVVAGYRSTSGNLDFLIGRLLPSGALDGTFGSGGIKVLDFGSAVDMAHAVAVDNSGKIWVAGVTKDGTSGKQRFAVARLSATGATEQLIPIDVGGDSQDDIAYGIAVQPDDGNIVVVGSSTRSNGTRDMGVVRITASSGVVSAQSFIDLFAEDDVAYAVKAVSASEIYAVGYAQKGRYYDMALVRLGSTLSATYKRTVDLGQNHHDIAYAVEVGAGKVWLAGSTRVGSFQRFGLVRYLTDGTLDTDFGSGGKVVTAFNDTNASAQSIALSGSTAILAGSAQDAGASNGIAVARFLSDGSLDDSFGSRGRLTAHFGAKSDEGRRVIATGTKILVVGHKQGSSYEAISASFLP